MKGQKAFITAHIILLSLSLLTALHVLPGPDILGIALAFYCLFILPGILLGGIIGGPECGLLEKLCRLFVSGLLFLSSVIWLGLIPGISYAGIALGGVVLNVLLLALYQRCGAKKGRGKAIEAATHRTSSGDDARAKYALLAVILFALCFVFFYGSGEVSWDSDALDHISYVRRALDSGVLFPGDSFHRDGDGVGFDPRKGLWHPIMALWAFQGDSSPELLWRFIPSFICYFALAFFIWFALTLTTRHLYAAISLLLLLLFYGGEGIGWLIKAGFSRNVSQVLLWGGTAFIIRYYESGKKHYLFWAWASTIMGTAFHAVHALLIAVIGFAFLLYVAITREGRSWQSRFWISTPVLAVAAALPLAVRALGTYNHFNIVHTHRQGMLIFSRTLAMVDPVEVLTRFSPAFFFALLIMPIFFWTAAGGDRRKLVGTLFLVPALLVFNPFTGSALERVFGYLHYRLLYAAPLFCLLGLAIPGLFRLLLTGRTAGDSDTSAYRKPMEKQLRSKGRAARFASGSGKRLLAFILLCVFFIYPVRFSLRTFESSAKRIIEQGGVAAWNPDGIIETLRRDVPRHSVIVSDPRTSYVLSAFTDHFVAVTLDQHCSPSDTLVMTRLQETRDLFNPAVPLSSSVGWLEETGADFLLLNEHIRGRSDFFGTIAPGSAPLALEKFENCEGLLEEVCSGEAFHLFRIDKDAMGLDSIAACAGAAAGAAVCDSDMPRHEGFYMTGEMVLENFIMERESLAPGDTLRGQFCWSTRDTVGFGLPMEWVIRIDTDFPKGLFYRRWYGKQYRRSIERKNGTFYRFTQSGLLASGFSRSDQWEPGKTIKQVFAIPISKWLHPGRFEVRVKTRRLSYLPNRRISDYMMNEDTLEGALVGVIHIGEKPQSERDENNVD